MLAVGHIDDKKHTQHVKFDAELDLTQFMHPESPELRGAGNLVYELVAVMEHQGLTAAGGHYITHAKVNPGTGGNEFNYCAIATVCRLVRQLWSCSYEPGHDHCNSISLLAQSVLTGLRPSMVQCDM